MKSDKNNQAESKPPVAEESPPAGKLVPPYWYLPQPYSQDELSLADLWQVLMANKWLISSAALSVAVVALVISLLMTPIYRAESLLSPVEQGGARGGLSGLVGQFGGLADLAGISLPGSGDVETALATLQSRDFLVRFIRDETLKPVLFSDDWDKDKNAWIERGPSVAERIEEMMRLSGPVLASSNLAPGEPSDWDAFELLHDEMLHVSQDNRTGLVTVAVEWEDPALAADWTNQLIERVNSDLRRRAVEEAERSIAFLRAQVEETSLADLRSVLFRLIEEHTKNITLARVNEEYAFKVIDPAVPPENRVHPRRGLMVLLGLLFGGVSAVFLVMVRQAIARSRVQHDNPHLGSD